MKLLAQCQKDTGVSLSKCFDKILRLHNANCSEIQNTNMPSEASEDVKMFSKFSRLILVQLTTV